MAEIKTVLGGSKIVDIAWEERMDDQRGEIPDRVINFARHIERSVIAAAQLQVEAGRELAALKRVFNTGHLPGAAHGNRIKIVAICPMYGDEKEISIDDVIRHLKSASVSEQKGDV